MTPTDLADLAARRLTALHAEIRALKAERSALRKELGRARLSRTKWRSLARKRGEKLYNYRRNGKAPWHNIQLSERDLARILEMPPR